MANACLLVITLAAVFMPAEAFHYVRKCFSSR